MSLPHLLLVDDSEAILAYEKAALSGHYTLSTATNGRDALEKIYQIRPAAVLLDLSMPEMDGDEVLARIKADPEVAKIPIIVVSSEKQRAEACLKVGAAAYLPKPIRADELIAAVARTIDQTLTEERKGNLAVLFASVGPLEVGIPLDSVYTVILQPATLALPAGTSYLSELFEIHGQPVCLLDLAHRLGVEHEFDLSERKVVVIRQGETLLGLCVDRVRDPEEFAPADVTMRTQLANSSEEPLGRALLAVVRTTHGRVPVLEPKALLSRGLLRKLPALIKEHGSAGKAATIPSSKPPGTEARKPEATPAAPTNRPSRPPVGRTPDPLPPPPAATASLAPGNATTPRPSAPVSQPVTPSAPGQGQPATRTNLPGTTPGGLVAGGATLRPSTAMPPQKPSMPTMPPVRSAPPMAKPEAPRHQPPPPLPNQASPVTPSESSSKVPGSKA